MLSLTYHVLDLTAGGRDEDWSMPHPSGWGRLTIDTRTERCAHCA